MKIIFLESIDWAKIDDPVSLKKKLKQCIADACIEACKILGRPKSNINIIVQPNKFTSMKEYGVGGFTHDSEYIRISFDPDLPFGVDHMLGVVRSTVFHEASHTYRWLNIDWEEEIISGAVLEGLATVFERDYCNYVPLYAKYESDPIMKKWYKEINNCKSFNSDEYKNLTFDHPDGRKWVLYKVGTWLVDRAVKNSGKSIIQLTKMSTKEIIDLAKI